MSDHAATVADDQTGEARAITLLSEGWGAVGVAPGSTDERLAGLDDAMLPFSAPGTAAGALRAAGLWEPGTTRDLDGEDWWFRCRFAAAPPDAGEEIGLRLDGLATVADVWLNGEHVLASDNMHVGHEVDVTALLEAENELVIGIKALAPLLAVRRPRPRWRTRLVTSQSLRWVRTSLFGRIPAFAPGPAPVGPWRPVALARRRHVAFDDVALRANLSDAGGVLSVNARIRGLDGFRPTLATARVVGPSGSVEAPLTVEERGGQTSIAGRVQLPDAAPWWPHTHGAPALHEVTLVVSDDARTISVACGRVGFRSLEVTEEPGLALAVNGVPLFCRGGSLLPDAFTVDPAPDDLRTSLERCRDAGMNMIRLSGVGTYGSEDLYRLCDELGLLVWQDFPFANLDYPVADDAFRSSVEQEAHAFLDRAGSHPSLAILCGNSEIEQQVGMLGFDPELGRGPLFGELLPGVARELSVDAHYVTSSPTGGELSFRPNAGVAHYFGVGAYRRPLEDARRAEVRFAAECLAFANVPEDQTLAGLGGGDGVRLAHHPAWKAGVPRDAGTGWDFDDVRDHYLRELFAVDPVELRSVDPERYIALSRVVTGEVMAATLGEWRRARSTCRGALLWTLNDVLPGAGWGVLDSRGRTKAAYWYVRRALAPVALWLTDEGTNGIAVHAANDTAEPVHAEIWVALLRGDGQPLEEALVETELEPHATIESSVEGILGRFADAGHAYRFGPAAHDVIVVELRENGRLHSRALHFTGGLQAVSRPTDEIMLEATGTMGGDGRITAQIDSRSLAYAVAVDAPGFSASDDFFSVAPGRSHTVTLAPLSADASPQGVRLRPLNSRASAALHLS